MSAAQGFSLPPATGMLAAGLVGVSLLALSQSAYLALALQPGNTILGSHYVWNFITAWALERNIARFAGALALIVVLGRHAETAAVAASGVSAAAATRKVLTVTLLATGIAGAATSFAGIVSYMNTAAEEALYKPLYGAGPLLAALAVLAVEAGGSAAPFPAQAPGITFGLAPAAVLAWTLVTSTVLGMARDTMATLLGEDGVLVAV
jgi:hypothetical protein